MVKITKPIKYTDEVVEKELNSLLKQLKENKKLIYKGELFENRDYHLNRYSEWDRKYSNYQIPTEKLSQQEAKKEKLKHEKWNGISGTIKRIDKIFETRAITGAMKNELNATSTIFHLKNNYKWVDKQEIDQTTKTIDLGKLQDMSDDELDKYL